MTRWKQKWGTKPKDREVNGVHYKSKGSQMHQIYTSFSLFHTRPLSLQTRWLHKITKKDEVYKGEDASKFHVVLCSLSISTLIIS